MLWSVKRAPPLFPIRWMPYFRPIWHPVPWIQDLYNLFLFRSNRNSPFLFVWFWPDNNCSFPEIHQTWLHSIFQNSRKLFLDKLRYLFYCMTGVFIGTFFGMISSAVTVPYSGVDATIFIRSPSAGIVLKGIRYPAGLGSGDYSVFSIAWFLCIDCWYRAPHGREGDWHKASCLDRTRSGWWRPLPLCRGILHCLLPFWA